IAMAYGHVYVAQIAMGADKNQTLKAIKEAESYKGPSLIIAYSPCVEHGIKGGLSNHQRTQAKAVECGYLALYRFDPRNEKPLTIDSKEPQWDKFQDFLLNETRYNQLTKLKGGEVAQKMFDKTLADAQKRYAELVKKLAD
ncbi:MAG: pyruvate:ferredoxin (flavodoxin) oxidoreductase, partial [Anaerorhabdus sp.]